MWKLNSRKKKSLTTILQYFIFIGSLLGVSTILAESSYGPVEKNDVISHIARDYYGNDSTISHNQGMVAILRANPTAFRRGNINFLILGAQLVIPDNNRVILVTEKESIKTIIKHRKHALSQSLTILHNPQLPDIIKVKTSASNMLLADDSLSLERMADAFLKEEAASKKNLSKLVPIVDTEQSALDESTNYLAQEKRVTTDVSTIMVALEEKEALPVELKNTKEILDNKVKKETNFTEKQYTRVKELEEQKNKKDEYLEQLEGRIHQLELLLEKKQKASIDAKKQSDTEALKEEKDQALNQRTFKRDTTDSIELNGLNKIKSEQGNIISTQQSINKVDEPTNKLAADSNDELESELSDGSNDELESELSDGSNDELESELSDDSSNELESKLSDDSNDELESELSDDSNNDPENKLADDSNDEIKQEKIASDDKKPNLITSVLSDFKEWMGKGWLKYALLLILPFLLFFIIRRRKKVNADRLVNQILSGGIKKESKKTQKTSNTINESIIKDEKNNHKQYHDAAIKLDMATAYLDLGHKKDAMNILQEVMIEGSVDQQQVAKQLLRQL